MPKLIKPYGDFVPIYLESSGKDIMFEIASAPIKYGYLRSASVHLTNYLIDNGAINLTARGYYSEYMTLMNGIVITRDYGDLTGLLLVVCKFDGMYCAFMNETFFASRKTWKKYFNPYLRSIGIKPTDIIYKSQQELYGMFVKDIIFGINDLEAKKQVITSRKFIREYLEGTTTIISTQPELLQEEEHIDDHIDDILEDVEEEEVIDRPGTGEGIITQILNTPFTTTSITPNGVEFLRTPLTPEPAPITEEEAQLERELRAMITSGTYSQITIPQDLIEENARTEEHAS